MNNIKKLIVELFHALGYNLVKYSPKQELNRMFNYYKIESVIDIGANEGQFARFVRKAGFKGNLYSFEPLNDAFDKLSKYAEHDDNWHVYNFAIGDDNKTSEINISENSVSSSILEMMPAHLQSAPQSAYLNKQKIEIKTLDSIADKLGIEKNNFFLKIDAQGFEKNVLIGAGKSLKMINTIQLEMSVVPLYNGEELFFEISKYLYDKGYRMIKIIPGYFNKQTREELQFDGVFHRD